MCFVCACVRVWLCVATCVSGVCVWCVYLVCVWCLLCVSHVSGGDGGGRDKEGSRDEEFACTSPNVYTVAAAPVADALS